MYRSVSQSRRSKTQEASGNIGLPLLNDDFARSVIDIAIDARAFDVDDDGNDRGTEGKGTAGVTPPADPR